MIPSPYTTFLGQMHVSSLVVNLHLLTLPSLNQVQHTLPLLMLHVLYFTTVCSLFGGDS
jgi:hypothetical protein